MMEKKYGGYCSLAVGFLFLLVSIAIFIQPTAFGRSYAIPLLILSFVFIAIGLTFIALERRPQKEKKVKDDSKQYKQTFPYFCDNCKKFSHTLLEYCENCGTMGQIRMAKEEDYIKYFKKG